MSKAVTLRTLASETAAAAAATGGGGDPPPSVDVRVAAIFDLMAALYAVRNLSRATDEVGNLLTANDITFGRIASYALRPLEGVLGDARVAFVALLVDSVTGTWGAKDCEHRKRHAAAARGLPREVRESEDAFACAAQKDPVFALFDAQATDEERTLVRQDFMGDGAKEGFLAWAARTRRAPESRADWGWDTPMPFPPFMLPYNRKLRALFRLWVLRHLRTLVSLRPDQTLMLYLGSPSTPFWCYKAPVDRAAANPFGAPLRPTPVRRPGDPPFQELDPVSDRREDILSEAFPYFPNGEADIMANAIILALASLPQGAFQNFYVYTADADVPVILAASAALWAARGLSVKVFLYRNKTDAEHSVVPLARQFPLCVGVRPPDDHSALCAGEFLVPAFFFLGDTDITEKQPYVPVNHYLAAMRWCRRQGPPFTDWLEPVEILPGTLTAPPYRIWSFHGWVLLAGVARILARARQQWASARGKRRSAASRKRERDGTPVSQPPAADGADEVFPEDIPMITRPPTDPSAVLEWWTHTSQLKEGRPGGRKPLAAEDLWGRYGRWAVAMLWATRPDVKKDRADALAVAGLGYVFREDGRFDRAPASDPPADPGPALEDWLRECFTRGLTRRPEEGESL